MSVINLIKKRESVRRFNSPEINTDLINGVLEAARWAPSAFNGQPWQFIIAHKGSADYDKIFRALFDGNQKWADSAPLFMVAVSNTVFEQNGRVNLHARYETGMAVAQLSLQAVEYGIAVHQMAGFDRDAIISSFNLKENQDPITVIALGFSAEEANEHAPSQTRKRKPASELIINKNESLQRAS